MDSYGNKHGSGTSSLPSELFGTKEPSSNDVFASIFPPQKGVGRNSACSEVVGGGSSWQKQHVSGSGYIKQDNSKGTNTIYGEERAAPCSLSSSLYYGGQENIYSHPSSHHTTTAASHHNTTKKDAGEEDPSGASRGNWWQGSLYY